mmetsp:Transcript_21/g.35  ORF Transcript_21/g.35 Transcript_21/m.35 type:complete len:212 (-) Transcript_21:156-791(-)|eukprot:CAMPEP_0178997070 /NCGR_PEP_ID=MMETSP0795-20121207/8728_1 /TAXON_ID=88552 /ORGANISM="Amoebophrya sp., Strain Ameob2" /LENGTH=211 /DNA_ID=CAMNT_0020689547 /DNA_START=127 /DNA_END=762 /DNA_ORIENTATION=+
MNGLSFDEFEAAPLSQLYDRNFANAKELATGWKDLEFPAKALHGGSSGCRPGRGSVQHAIQDGADPREVQRRDGSRTRPENRVRRLQPALDNPGGPRSDVRSSARALASGSAALEAGAFMRDVRNAEDQPVRRNDLYGAGSVTHSQRQHGKSSWKPSAELQALGNVSARPAVVVNGASARSGAQTSARPGLAEKVPSGGGEKGAFVGWTSN